MTWRGSWHKRALEKIVDAKLFRLGFRIFVVKINRGAVIARATSPVSAYYKAYQFVKALEEKD